ncbi:MAG: hypothetical protein K8R87_12510, partial [Verrucomicrobia bacterium]|nr:hypothetical protein [Verrucomicrobiota bacterium]
EGILTSSGILASGRPLFRSRRALVIGFAFLLILLIGSLDKATGWEISVYVFYAVPILLVVWQGKKRLAVFLALMCGVVWWAANISEHPYRSEWSYHWASLGRMVYFVLVALGGNAVRAKQESDRALIETLKNVRQLEHEIVEAGEQERRRIGRDLHDGLCQQLAAIGFAAKSLADDLQARALPEAGEAEKIEELLRDSVVQARDLARGIFPLLTGATGLAVALDELAVMTRHLTHMKVSFREEGEIRLGDSGAAMHLYRIAQEALNNSLRHSHGTEVIISLRLQGETVRLTVADDGSGPPENLEMAEGMGLKTMAYRARALGATLEIQRRSPRGTLVSCTYNINERPHHGDIH